MTPVSSQDYISKARELMKRGKLSAQDWRTIIEWFIEYCLAQDQLYLSLPKSDSYLSQKTLRESLHLAWVEE